MISIAIFGAGGSMGTRASLALVGDSAYRVLHVEPAPAGRERLEKRGITPVSRDEALRQADTVLLAVPDHLITGIAAEVIPLLQPGTLVICLDPAAPLTACCRSAPISRTSSRIRGIRRCSTTRKPSRPVATISAPAWQQQSIVSALMQGGEADYEKGEAISRKMFGPILRSHRLTVEQMALLEPALAETLAATCLTVIREGIDEVIRRGVPAEAARDFMLGHLKIELAIVFNESGWKFSQGCQRAIDEARPMLFQSDWKKIFEPEQLKASVARIAGEGLTYRTDLTQTENDSATEHTEVTEKLDERSGQNVGASRLLYFVPLTVSPVFLGDLCGLCGMLFSLSDLSSKSITQCRTNV